MNCKCKKWLVLLILLILLLSGIIIGFIFCLKEKQDKNSSEIIKPSMDSDGGVGLIIDPNAENDQLSVNENTMEQDVVISGRGTITLSANKKDVTIDFYNPKENAERYYLTFELRINNDSKQGYEVLYTSGLVEAGKHINQITLSRELDKGVYEAVVHVQPYRMNEEKSLTNNADMKTLLIVE